MSEIHHVGNPDLLRRARRHRLIRRLHLWIGAWGAIAAILFGSTGFVQNHRALLKLPQGDTTELSKVELPVPESARATPEAMLAWLRDTQHLPIDGQRVQPAKPFVFNGEKIRPPARWTFNGGTARTSTLAEYSEGNASVTIQTSRQSPMATLLRLHKGVGGSMGWILLTDSFALSMVALGISGLLMWARGRSVRQMALSVVGVAVFAVLLIGGLRIA